jgi:eukaryotic-like serine/threonine-protein kinase
LTTFDDQLGARSRPDSTVGGNKSDPMVGRIIDGRYRVDAVLAAGGMGRIYKAEQLGLRRTVAIKVLTADPAHQLNDPLFRERFAREATMASSLTSPHTITIFQHGRTDDDVYYIVMEYVDGVTLGKVLRQEGCLPIARATNILGQVCLSLGEAHERGIVHRDIKPSNIMLINGRYDQVKVLDFGIAKQLSREADGSDEELTSSHSYIGTPEYMAPECFDGRVDHRSDIYSVGVVLYLALAGRLPFKGKSATQTILMVLKDSVPAIEPVLALPRPLQDVIFACLEKDPDRRPSSLDEVLQVLRACQVHAQSAELGAPFPDTDVELVIERDPESPSTPRPSTAARLATSKRARPRRKPVKTLLAGIALLSAGGAAGLMVRLAVRSDPAPSALAAPARAASQEPVTPAAPAQAAPAPAQATPAQAAPAQAAPAQAATVTSPEVAEPAAAAADTSGVAAEDDVAAAPRRDASHASSERPRTGGARSSSRGAKRSAPEPTRKKRADSSERGSKPDAGGDGYKDSPY